MKFRYTIELKEGYIPTMETDCENEMTITIEAKNRAIANRMIQAMLKDNDNVISCHGTCVREQRYAIIYRVGDLYKIIKGIEGIDNAYMILTMVTKAGYTDCRIVEDQK